MTKTLTLDSIRSSPTVVKILAWPFDIEFNVPHEDDAQFTLIPETPFEVVAADGTGGVFAAYGTGVIELLPVLYVSTDGQSGRIAKNFTEAIQIIVALPYWRDLLKFSGSGRIAEMKRAVPYLEKELYEDNPEIDDLRRTLVGELKIQPIDNPLETLYESVVSSDCVATTIDGDECDSLFNTFVVTDNPSWRR